MTHQTSKTYTNAIMDTPAKFEDVLTHNGVCSEEDIDYLCERYQRMPQKKLFLSLLSPMPANRGRRFSVLQRFWEGHETVKAVGTCVTIGTVEKVVAIVGTVAKVEAGDTVETVATTETVKTVRTVERDTAITETRGKYINQLLGFAIRTIVSELSSVI